MKTVNPPISILNNQTPDSDWYKGRIFVFLCFVIPGFIFLFIRLFYLQVIDGENLRRLSENNCIRLQSIDPPRGLIFDRNGQLLVDNRPSFDLSLVPRDAKPLDTTINYLAQYASISPLNLWEEIEKNRKQPSFRPILIKNNISRDTLAVLEVKRFDLPGIVVDVRLRRLYVNSQSMAHILGYVGEISRTELKSGMYSGYRRADLVGKSGVEKSFESVLKGEQGGRQIEVNAAGRLVRVIRTVDASPGNNVFLSIDMNLQKKAEDLLSGVRGSVVAIEPSTGFILAMASSPTFDLNMFVDGFSQSQWQGLVNHPHHPLRNKAIQAEYPPASTYKIITAMAGLEEGAIDEKTTMVCPGFYKYADREYRCWKKGGHGSVNLERAIAESCDVYFYQVGLRLGVDRLASYAKACGFGSSTGIQLDQESRGLVPTSAWKKRRMGIPWQGGETLSVAIGQGYNLATPLQLAIMISSFANGGSVLIPLIVKKIENASGETIKEFAPEIRWQLPVSNKNMEILRKSLWEVVNGRSGTARTASIDGIDVSGKTGTAQVFSRKTENEKEEKRAEHLRSHALFVAYAPSVNPKIALSVIVEHGEQGSKAAAPIARELISTYLSERSPIIK